MWLFRPFADGQAGREIVVTPTPSCLPTKEGACDAVVVVVVEEDVVDDDEDVGVADDRVISVVAHNEAISGNMSQWLYNNNNNNNNTIT